ncbi:MAG: hypothetical protein ACFFCV_02535 [Promethearchaeota archaeon]
MIIETTSVVLTKEQLDFIENIRFDNRVSSKSIIFRTMINFFILYPEKLKELQKNDKKK